MEDARSTNRSIDCCSLTEAAHQPTVSRPPNATETKQLVINDRSWLQVRGIGARLPAYGEPGIHIG
jgi:hypothetical protein